MNMNYLESKPLAETEAHPKYDHSLHLYACLTNQHSLLVKATLQKHCLHWCMSS